LQIAVVRFVSLLGAVHLLCLSILYIDHWLVAQS
jgi:hypothetical protein